MRINFSFGAKKASLKTMATLAIIVSVVSACLKINEKHIWDLIYESTPNTPIRRELQKDPEIIERKAIRTVDKAIRDYEVATGDDGSVRLPKPHYSEKPVNDSLCYTPECRALGGEIRLCASWVPDCPKKND